MSIYNYRARKWSLSFIQFTLYLITSLGAGGTLYFLLKKDKKAIKEDKEKEN